jgi:basic membrane protein A
MRLKAAILAIFLSITALTPTHAQDQQVKIAVAYDIGFLGDNSFNDAVNQALLVVKKRYKLVEPFVREVPTNGSAVDRLTRLRFLAQNGYNLIIAVGPSYRETVRRVSMEYPDTQFAIINDKSIGQMNVSNIFYLEDQGAYVAGVIAALASKRKTIGFIGSEMELLASYTQGAKAISKRVKVVNIPYPDNLDSLKSGLNKIDIGYATWDGDATVVTTVLESYAKKVRLIVEKPDQYFADLNTAQTVILASINKNLAKPINQLVASALQNRAIIDVIDEESGIYGRQYGLKNKGISFTLVSNFSALQQSKIQSALNEYLKKPKSR